MSGLNDKDVNINYIINTIGTDQFYSFMSAMKSAGSVAQDLIKEIDKLKEKFAMGVIPKKVTDDLKDFITQFGEAQNKMVEAADERAKSIMRINNMALAGEQRFANEMAEIFEKIRRDEEKNEVRKRKRRELKDEKIDLERYQGISREGMLKPKEYIHGEIDTERWTVQQDSRAARRMRGVQARLQIQQERWAELYSKDVIGSPQLDALGRDTTLNGFVKGRKNLPDLKQQFKEMGDSIGESTGTTTLEYLSELKELNETSKRVNIQHMKNSVKARQPLPAFRTSLEGPKMGFERWLDQNQEIKDLSDLQENQELDNYQKERLDALNASKSGYSSDKGPSTNLGIYTMQGQREQFNKIRESLGSYRVNIDDNPANYYPDDLQKSMAGFNEIKKSLVGAAPPMQDFEASSAMFKAVLKTLAPINAGQISQETVADLFGDKKPEDLELIKTMENFRSAAKKIPIKFNADNLMNGEIGDFSSPESNESVREKIGAIFGKIKGHLNDTEEAGEDEEKQKKKVNTAGEKANKTFADFGKRVGFMGFIASFVIGRISDSINKFARTIFDFGTGLLSTDKATQTMIDNIVNVAMGGGENIDAWTQKAVEDWQKWYNAAKEGQSEIGKINILLMGVYASAAKGVTTGITKIIDGIGTTIKDGKVISKLSDPEFLKQIENSFAIIGGSIAEVVIDLVNTITNPENARALAAFATFMGSFFKGFYTTLISIGSLLLKTFGQEGMGVIGENLGRVFAGITLLGTAMSVLGTTANILAILQIPKLALALTAAVANAFGIEASSAGISFGIKVLVGQMGTSILTWLSGVALPIIIATVIATSISMLAIKLLEALNLFKAPTGEPTGKYGNATPQANMLTDLMGWSKNGVWNKDLDKSGIPKTPKTDAETFEYDPPTLDFFKNIFPPQTRGFFDSWEGISKNGIGEYKPTAYQSGLGQATPLSNWTERGITGPSVKTVGMTSQTMPSAPPAGIATANFYNTFNIQNFYANGLSDATDLSTTLGNSTLEQIRRAGVSF